jgi:hypothetical protein
MVMLKKDKCVIFQHGALKGFTAIGGTQELNIIFMIMADQA